MKTLLTLSTLALGGATLASGQDMIASWDLNEGTGTTTTQYQRGSETWNQVTNPEANLAATASADFTGIAAWGAASSAPNSTASLTFNATGGENQLDTNVSGVGLAGTGAKTFVAWINPTGVDSTGAGILSYSPTKGATNGADLRLLLNTNGQLRAEVNGGFFDYNTVNFVNGGWKMVAAIFDGNTNTSSFYIGGTGIVTPTGVGARAIDTANSVTNGGILDIVLGGAQVDTRSFIGGIDMAAVYSGALSEAQLNSLYTDGITAVPEPATFAMLAGLLALGLVMWRRRG
jgi:hypothetical protein